jgi:hypothetical protein
MAPVLASAHVWCGSGTSLDGAALNDRRSASRDIQEETELFFLQIERVIFLVLLLRLFGAGDEV